MNYDRIRVLCGLSSNCQGFVFLVGILLPSFFLACFSLIEKCLLYHLSLFVVPLHYLSCLSRSIFVCVSVSLCTLSLFSLETCCLSCRRAVYDPTRLTAWFRPYLFVVVVWRGESGSNGKVFGQVAWFTFSLRAQTLSGGWWLSQNETVISPSSISLCMEWCGYSFVLTCVLLFLLPLLFLVTNRWCQWTCLGCIVSCGQTARRHWSMAGISVRQRYQAINPDTPTSSLIVYVSLHSFSQRLISIYATCIFLFSRGFLLF